MNNYKHLFLLSLLASCGSDGAGTHPSVINSDGSLVADGNALWLNYEQVKDCSGVAVPDPTIIILDLTSSDVLSPEYGSVSHHENNINVSINGDILFNTRHMAAHYILGHSYNDTDFGDHSFNIWGVCADISP